MNELTKQEIEDVELVYRAFCGDGRKLTDLEQSIMKKLKSMVDSYCEPCKHQSTNFDDGIYYCNECGHCVP